MARYKPYDVDQDKLIPVSFREQILPGTFEYALSEIVDRHIDLSVFASRYANDDTGRLAYDPAVLLKIVLYGYYKGIISSRKLEEACARNVMFMALSADAHPHFTTLAGFVSKMSAEIASVFTDVLMYASELGLIGKDTFAVDGCKLPSNASKERSLRASCPHATFVHPCTARDVERAAQETEEAGESGAEDYCPTPVARYGRDDLADSAAGCEEARHLSTEDRAHSGFSQDRQKERRPQRQRAQNQHHRSAQRQDVHRSRCGAGV